MWSLFVVGSKLLVGYLPYLIKILKEESFDPSCAVSSSKFLAPILQPWPSEEMEAHEVSTLVNSPENDSGRLH